jgi:RNA polymerase sigma factor (sigma-70 family)
VAEYRPLVMGVCRRYVVEPADVEDAAQETFVKLARQAEEIRGELGAWLSTVASTTALDYARRSLRERTRRQRLASAPKHANQEAMSMPSWLAVETCLKSALDGLDGEMRSVVLARFFSGETVRQLAEQTGVTGSAISRRVSKTLERMRRSLAAMGYGSVEDILEGAWEVGRERVGDGPLSRMEQPRALSFGGLGRKIRVGLLASHKTADTAEEFSVVRQLKNAQHFDGAEFQLTALVEPGNEEDSNLERGMRHRRIHHGILDATNVEELKLLDVISVSGPVLAVTVRVLDAIAEAVESGVGLLNAGRLGLVYPGFGHPSVRRLMLAEAVSVYHTPGVHDLPRRATVVEEHAVIPGVLAGTSMMLPGCGPVYGPKAGAKALMLKDEPVSPQDPPDERLNGLRMAVMVMGKLGRGRVMTLGTWPGVLGKLPGLRGQFGHHVVKWLAEERVAERGLWESLRRGASGKTG